MCFLAFIKIVFFAFGFCQIFIFSKKKVSGNDSKPKKDLNDPWNLFYQKTHSKGPKKVKSFQGVWVPNHLQNHLELFVHFCFTKNLMFTFFLKNEFPRPALQIHLRNFEKTQVSKVPKLLSDLTPIPFQKRLVLKNLKIKTKKIKNQQILMKTKEHTYIYIFANDSKGF